MDNEPKLTTPIYRKPVARLIVTSAVQWHRNGDHPNDACETFTGSDGEPFQGEGKVVRYFRHPYVAADARCNDCGNTMHEHGFIDQPTLAHYANVCPGDYIILDDTGRYWPMHPELYAMSNRSRAEREGNG